MYTHVSYAGLDAQYIWHKLVVYSRGVRRVCDIHAKHQVLNGHLKAGEDMIR